MLPETVARVSEKLFWRRRGSTKRTPFKGERVLSEKDVALKNVFSNCERLDAAARDSQKLFSCRSCSVKRTDACGNVFSPKGRVFITGGVLKEEAFLTA